MECLWERFSYCSKNNPEYLSLDTLKKEPMFLGDEDLVISKNNQNGNTHEIKKRKGTGNCFIS